MKKKLQLSETQLTEFIENTVNKIKKERQSKVVKLSENDLYKIVDKVAAEQKNVVGTQKKVKKPAIVESKKEKKITKDKFRKLRENRRSRKIFESPKNGDRKKIIKEQFDLSTLGADVITKIKGCIWGNISLWGDRSMLTKVPASCYFAWMETPDPLNPTESQKACPTDLMTALKDNPEMSKKFMAKVPEIVKCVLKSQGSGNLVSTVTDTLGDLYTKATSVFGLEESNKKRNKK